MHRKTYFLGYTSRFGYLQTCLITYESPMNNLRITYDYLLKSGGFVK